MYNTKGDVAVTNFKANSLHDFVQYPKYKFFAFPQPRYVLNMFLTFEHFSASRSCRKVPIQKSAAD